MKLDRLDWELYGAIILAIVLWGAVIASLFGAAGVFADCLITWSPNPASEQVTSYRVHVDALAASELTSTSVLCSELGVDPHVGRHNVYVTALNDWGESDPSDTVPFGSPQKVTGISVSRSP